MCGVSPVFLSRERTVRGKPRLPRPRRRLTAAAGHGDSSWLLTAKDFDQAGVEESGGALFPLQKLEALQSVAEDIVRVVARGQRVQDQCHVCFAVRTARRRPGALQA